MNFCKGEFAMKSFLTLTMLLFSCQPAGESVSGAKTFVDADACSIEYDYQFGLYKLKDADNGNSGEFAVEVERAGKNITAVRIKQVGSRDPAERVVIKDLVENESLEMLQEELEMLAPELEEAEASRAKLMVELNGLVERKTQGEREADADQERIDKQQEHIDRLVEGTRREIELLRQQTETLNKQAKDLGLDLEVAKQNRQNAQRRLDIVKHGVPYLTLFGTDESTGTQQIRLHITYRPDEPNPIGIWGIDIDYTKDGKQQTMSYDPFGKLGSLQRMKEQTVRSRYFPTAARDCGSNSRSGTQN